MLSPAYNPDLLFGALNQILARHLMPACCLPPGRTKLDTYTLCSRKQVFPGLRLSFSCPKMPL
jgi:hypothetical protein